MTTRDQIFNIIYRCGAAALRNFKGDSVTVLNLHRISEERDFFFDPIQPKLFDKLVAYCAKNYEVISFKEIDKKTTKRKLILSFDDGYYDFVDYAIPILQKYEVPCNHNLVNICLSNNAKIWTQQLNDVFNYLKDNKITNDKAILSYGIDFEKYGGNWMAYYIAFFKKLLTLESKVRIALLDELYDKYNIHIEYKMMNWQNAKTCMDDYNVEIGCHTYNHDSLSTIESEEQLNAEIGQSVSQMEEKLNTKINILALPNGQYNKKVLKYVERIGLKYVLFGGDQINKTAHLNNKFNLIQRIGLSNESFAQTVLRSELFHSKFKSVL